MRASGRRAFQAVAVILIVSVLAVPSSASWALTSPASPSPSAGRSASGAAQASGSTPWSLTVPHAPASAGSPSAQPSSLGNVTSVNAGSEPVALLYEGGSGYVYVANSNSSNVTVIQGVTQLGAAADDLNPTAMAYDAADAYVYVADYGSTQASEISGTSLITTNYVGQSPDSVVYDPSHQIIDVASESANTVTVFNNAGYVTAVPVGNAPFAEAYDSANGYVYVADYGEANVTVLDNTSVVATVHVGFSPVALAYDAANEQIYVANWNSANVSVINGTSLVGTVPVGNQPWALSYDSKNGDVYVANENSNNVSVIRGSTVVGAVSVGTYPKALATDNVSGEVYVANWGSNNVSVINGTTLLGSIPVGANPDAVAFDAGDGDVYVANYGANNVSVISPWLPVTFSESGLPSGTSWSVNLSGSVRSSLTSTIEFFEPSGTYAYTVGGVSGYNANPTSGSVTVTGAAAGVPISYTPTPPPTYSVSFTESGLPSGTSWSMNLSGSIRSSTTSSIVYSEPSGTYAYTVGSVTGYVANPTSGSVTVTSSAVNVPISYTSASPPTYSVSFTESGLPSGTSWSVNLSGSTRSSTTSSIVFSEPSGTYAYTVGSVTGYVANPTSGSVTVTSAAVSVAIAYTSTSVATYSVSFTESGLPSGTTWSVTLNGSTNSSSARTIGFTVIDGTYNFSVQSVSGFAVFPSNGQVKVHGAALQESVTYSRTFSVNFAETGLPGGSTWAVTLNGSQTTSTASSITFTVVNGTYDYTVAAPTGFVPSPSSGAAGVAGQGVNVTVAMSKVTTPTTYSVVFEEVGLPSGTSWSVTLNGSLHSSTTSSLVFNETNYTYSYAIGTVPGYTSNFTSGSLRVAGSGKIVDVAFSAASGGGGGSSSNGFTMTDWIALAVVVALAAVVGLVLVLRRRRHP